MNYVDSTVCLRGTKVTSSKGGTFTRLATTEMTSRRVAGENLKFFSHLIWPVFLVLAERRLDRGDLAQHCVRSATHCCVT